MRQNAADIFVLDNALGYALNQGGTAQFGLTFDKRNPFDFALDYAVVTHGGLDYLPGGEGYLANLGNPSPQLLKDLAAFQPN